LDNKLLRSTISLCHKVGVAFVLCGHSPAVIVAKKRSRLTGYNRRLRCDGEVSGHTHRGSPPESSSVPRLPLSRAPASDVLRAPRRGPSSPRRACSVIVRIWFL